MYNHNSSKNIYHPVLRFVKENIAFKLFDSNSYFSFPLLIVSRKHKMYPFQEINCCCSTLCSSNFSFKNTKGQSIRNKSSPVRLKGGNFRQIIKKDLKSFTKSLSVWLQTNLYIRSLKGSTEQQLATVSNS